MKNKALNILTFCCVILAACHKKATPVSATKANTIVTKPSIASNYNDSIYDGKQQLPISKTQKSYQSSYSKLLGVLRGDEKLSFTEAVFAVENAWFGDTLNYQGYLGKIKFLASLSKKYASANSLLYEGGDKDTVQIHASVFNVMTKPIPVRLQDGSTVNHPPFVYDFEDYTGSKDWASMMVTKLLQTHKGNCHSLPFLYKMVCEQLNVPVYFALAPGHLYIKNYARTKGWENIELTSGSFTYDAWLIASGYIHPDAVRNALYLDTLGTTKSIALCLLDLAQGYERKDTLPNLDFILQCTQVVLRYFPTCVPAMLKQAETHKKQLNLLLAKYNVPNWQALPAEAKGKQLFETMQAEYTHLYELGYRPMPDNMHRDWLTSLKQAHNKK